jgi:hypothetical protein
MAGPGFVGSWTRRLGERLRFPHLFLLAAGLFLLDLFVPDFLPFADEIFLALLTVLLGSLRRKRPRQ